MHSSFVGGEGLKPRSSELSTAKKEMMSPDYWNGAIIRINTVTLQNILESVKL